MRNPDGDRNHSGGFKFRIMPPSWHPVPVCVPRLRCRRAVIHRHDDCAASIPKSGPEIKNQCTNKAVSEENLAAIPKSGLEIKNQCTNKAVSEENLASIPKSGPEIKNHCSRGLVAVCRRNHSSLPQRRLESDAEDRCSNDCCRRNYSPLHRFPSLALKSRIDAQIRLFPRKTLHRFTSLALKSRIDAHRKA